MACCLAGLMTGLTNTCTFDVTASCNSLGAHAQTVVGCPACVLQEDASFVALYLLRLYKSLIAWPTGTAVPCVL